MGMGARRLMGVALAAGLIGAACARGATSSIVSWGSRMTVDSDGDGIADLLDNAPGTSNPSQVDADMDQIGDAIDPTPFLSQPFLGDPGLGMGGPYTITTGSHAMVDYVMIFAEPPGQWGHIDLDLDNDSVFDATYFGPLTFTNNVIDIAPGVFSSAGWDLNTPGSYTLGAKAFGPGMQSQNETFVTVNVVAAPEAGTLGVLGIGAGLLVRRRGL